MRAIPPGVTAPSGIVSFSDRSQPQSAKTIEVETEKRNNMSALLQIHVPPPAIETEPHPFARVSEFAIIDPKLSDRAVRVLCGLLCGVYSKAATLTISNERLAERLGKSVPSIKARNPRAGEARLPQARRSVRRKKARAQPQASTQNRRSFGGQISPPKGFRSDPLTGQIRPGVGVKFDPRS